MKEIETLEELRDVIHHPLTFEIDTKPGKHDYAIHTCVTLIDDKYYQFSYTTSYNEGTQFWDSIKLTEVRPVEVTTIKWEPVKVKEVLVQYEFQNE